MLPNVVLLMGRIYNEDMRYTHSGKPVLNARLGVIDNNGQVMVDIVFWGSVAERAQKLIDFNTRPNILIQGSLRQDRWNNAETGEPRTKLSVKVERFFVLADIHIPVTDIEYDIEYIDLNKDSEE